jgi:hypothetical protein
MSVRRIATMFNPQPRGKRSVAGWRRYGTACLNSLGSSQGPFWEQVAEPSPDAPWKNFNYPQSTLLSHETQNFSPRRRA